MADYILAWFAANGLQAVRNELGIPAIEIGPRGKRVGRKEEIAVDVMVRAAQRYALMARDICSRERPVA
jgi:hypothetical protein